MNKDKNYKINPLELNEENHLKDVFHLNSLTKENMTDELRTHIILCE